MTEQLQSEKKDALLCFSAQPRMPRAGEDEATGDRLNCLH